MFSNITKKFKKIYKRSIFAVLLFWRKNKKRFFYISFKRGIPKIHINEQYERLTKWALRILTLVGLISSVVAFQEWYLNLFLALGLLGIEQLLEKSIFVYFTFYLTAIPEYKPEDWKGMVWVHSENSVDNYFEVGIFFSTKEAAKRIFSVIKHWSKDGYEDTNNLVQVSVIIDSDSDNYHVYIYPNFDKDPLYIATKEERDKEQPQKEHVMEAISIMLCKGFEYSTSTFPRFEKFYKDGESYYLSAYILENNKPLKLTDLGFIKKKTLKIKNQKDLTYKDMEYEHSKFIIDTDKYKEESPPPASREWVVYKDRF